MGPNHAATIANERVVLMTRHQIKGAAAVAVILLGVLVLVWLAIRLLKSRSAPAGEPRLDAATPVAAEPERPRYVDQGVANVLAKASARADDSRSSDELLDGALRVVTELGGVSVPALQRRLEVDFAKASELVNRMEDAGFVSDARASGKRKVLPAAYEHVERIDGRRDD